MTAQWHSDLSVSHADIWYSFEVHPFGDLSIIYHPMHYFFPDRPRGLFRNQINYITTQTVWEKCTQNLKIVLRLTPNWFTRRVVDKNHKHLLRQDIFSSHSPSFPIVDNMVYPHLFLSDEDQQSSLRRAQQERKSFGLTKLCCPGLT
jgi:hypothetical protein